MENVTYYIACEPSTRTWTIYLAIVVGALAVNWYLTRKL